MKQLILATFACCSLAHAAPINTVQPQKTPLAAHGEHGAHQHHNHDHAQGQQNRQQNRRANARPQKFECQNGMTVTVTQRGNNRVRLTTDTGTGTANLRLASGGSGERYTSDRGFYRKPTEWHVKNGEALFSFTDPYNNKVETHCRAK